MVTIKTSEIDAAFKQDIQLFASPVKDNVPLFLMENTETGERYISPDLYYNVNTEPFTNPYSPGDAKYETYQNREVNRPYDGKVNYIRLLGYGVKKETAISTEIRYGLLDTLIVDKNKVVLTNAYKNQILIPISFCENCNESDVEEENDGLTLYHNFYDEWIAEVKGTVALTYTDSVANPDLTAGHTDLYVGKFVRGEATHANIRFDLPQNIDLSQASTITLKAYFESADTVLPANCKITVILRNSATGGTNQFLSTQNITKMNEWTTLSFDISGAAAKGTYDQLWLFFSMSDATGETTGQVFYIDDLRGPAFYIDSYSASTSAQYDSVIVDLSSNQIDLKGISNPVFKLDRVSSGAEIAILDYSFDAKHIYLKLDPDDNTSYSDVLELSFLSGKVVDMKGKVLPYFSKLQVRNGNAVNFKVVDAKTKKALPGVMVTMNSKTFSTNAQGEISFQMPVGDFDFALSKTYYQTYKSTLNITSDVNSIFELNVLQAGIKISVTDGKSAIEGAQAILNEVMKYTNASGEVDFENLDVLTNYAFEIAANGYKKVTDNLFLLKDTTLVVNLDFLNSVNELNDEKIKIFPNPTSGLITIQSQDYIQKISIYTSQGQSIRNYELNDLSYQINTKRLTRGVYLLMLELKGGVKYTEIIQVVD